MDKAYFYYLVNSSVYLSFGILVLIYKFENILTYLSGTREHFSKNQSSQNTNNCLKHSNKTNKSHQRNYTVRLQRPPNRFYEIHDFKVRIHKGFRKLSLESQPLGQHFQNKSCHLTELYLYTFPGICFIRAPHQFNGLLQK